MSSYQRSTRECSVNQVKPELLRAMQEYFQAHNLGEIETETLSCCETVSEKKAGSLLSGWLEIDMDTTIYTDIVLTAQSLIWARSGDRSGLHVVGAKLMNIRTRSQVSLF